jgi:hypothetical protein
MVPWLVLLCALLVRMMGTGHSEQVRQADTGLRLGFSSGVCYHNSAEPGSVPRFLDDGDYLPVLRACFESYVHLQAVQPTGPQPGYVPGGAA